MVSEIGMSEQELEKVVPVLDPSKKSRSKPFYIINLDSPFLIFFNAIPATLSLATVLVNLHFIAFGFSKADYPLQYLLWVSEFFFLLEILLNFLTTYKDPESFEIIISIRKIATNYITKGNFVLHTITVIPFDLIIRPEFEDNND